MKKLLVSILAGLIISTAAAQSLETFKTGFESFSNDFAAVLSYNATTGNIWSDAYIKNLPHFGVGVAAGMTLVPVASVDKLFATLNISVPAALSNIGIPLPSAAITAKIGGLILPFDIGLKGMMLPGKLKDALAGLGITADYNLLGASLRYALIKQNLLLPNVSVGASYNRLAGSISMALPLAPPPLAFGTHTLSLTNPALEFGFTTDSFDFTAQASKNIIFITPFVGAGLSMGKSNVTGGLKSSLLYDGVPTDAATIEALKTSLSAAGIVVPDVSPEGFMFSIDNVKPVFRVYGGFSLNLFVVYLDTLVMYVPVTKSLGANFMIRVQI